MNRAWPEKGSLPHKLANVLFRYRNTPHSTTDKTPAQLFLKREPRTYLSLVKPSFQRHVEKKQVASKLHRDGLHPMGRMFDLYQPVRVKNTRGGKEKWIAGTIVAVKGPETYLVRVPVNNRRFVHANHLIPDDTRDLGSHLEKVAPSVLKKNPFLDLQGGSLSPGKSSQIPSKDNISVPTVDNDIELEGSDESGCKSSDTAITRPCESEPGPVVTRSGRVIKPPNRLSF
ncbi:hypothetical protein P5673_030098 [Acropora cervicornis]|uniref:Uncharacterized protein n=1 Tax=Acropora cervicornis TaxID=6130 RepID=A0AAD9UTH7_ACRCE|nr:hypothetical protein P5673_030098 [Acropora cervicornis]